MTRNRDDHSRAQDLPQYRYLRWQVRFFDDEPGPNRGHKLVLADEFARALHAKFPRKLSREDCDDAVQDGLIAAATSATCTTLNPVQLEAWLRKAIHNKALALLKARAGRGRVPRPPIGNGRHSS